jgi:hypothetical protein
MYLESRKLSITYKEVLVSITAFYWAVSQVKIIHTLPKLSVGAVDSETTQGYCCFLTKFLVGCYIPSE